MLNDFHITYQRSTFGEITSLPFSLTAIGYDVNTQSAYSNYGLTPDSSLSISGAFGAYPGAPTRDIMPTYDINDNLSWIRGSIASTSASRSTTTASTNCRTSGPAEP